MAHSEGGGPGGRIVGAGPRTGGPRFAEGGDRGRYIEHGDRGRYVERGDERYQRIRIWEVLELPL
jgi:hypothetical protein